MARQPTPSHNAAHVLVSFQNDSLFAPNPSTPHGSSKRRPLSHANATRPPQNRRRVWRACESCRKKKIKCDGSDPCQCCLDNGAECIYAGEWSACGSGSASGRRVSGSAGGWMSPHITDSHGKRIQMLEDLVTRLVDDQRRLSEEIKACKDGSNGSSGGIVEMDPSQPDCSLELGDMDGIAPPGTGDHDRVAEIPPPTPTPPAPTAPVVLDQSAGSTIDPELVDASQRNGLGVAQPVGEVNAGGSADIGVSAYTDAYGHIYAQGDDAQYIGLGGTVAMVNECSGLRTHIRQRLLQRGFQLPESILNLRSLATQTRNVSKSSLPPVPLMDALIDAFFLNVYKLFPIIEAEDFQRQYLMLLSRNEARPGFMPLLYTILATSSRQIPDHPVWTRGDCVQYKNLDLGGHFYSLAVSALESTGASQVFPVHGTNINTVTALTLLGMYLSQAGLLNEAWTMIGQAVRLGLAIGLHRSPKRMGLPMIDVRRRCQLWWCLYVMDRLLSLHLGCPLGINDHDSDVLFPSARPSAPGFVAMTHLCRIIGRICTVNSVENSRKWRDPLSEPEVREKVQELSVELQNWRQNMLPDIGSDGAKTTEQCVLLSSYSSAVQLLFRSLMPTPHWQSSISDRALRDSFRSSVDCIRNTGEFIQSVPACHYFSFHGLNLFVSIMVLLHCIRQTDDESIRPEAEEWSRRGISLLSQMQAWPLATQFKAIAEEYQSFTQEIVSQGNRGRCNFEQHDIPALPAQEPTFDPWREFAEQIDLESNIFPSMPDAAWMSELFHLSPTKSQQDFGELPPLPESEAIEEQTPSKRRRLDKSQPVCGFSLKRSR